MEARDLRVTDAERDHVGEILQRAVGQGLLTLDEFSARMDAALAAVTRGELNTVLVDLPGMRMVAPSTPVAAPITVARPMPAPGWGGEVVRTTLSGITRTGPWRVPEVLRLRSRFANVTLDFHAAVLTTPIVGIVLDDMFSSVTLVVTGDTTVDVDGLALIGSTATSRCHAGPPPGRLHLAMRGRLVFGALTVRRR